MKKCIRKKRRSLYRLWLIVNFLVQDFDLRKWRIERTGIGVLKEQEFMLNL